VDGDAANQKWVMLVSLWGAGPNGGTATRYFVGEFDGRSFTNASPLQTVRWLDVGCDNYATITFSDIPNGRRVGIGWMSNWLYAHAQPTFPWRSAMTVPRELRLTAVPHGPPQLISQPVPELESLRGQASVIEDHTIEGTTVFPDIELTGAFEILLDCDWDTADEFRLSLKNGRGEETIVGYDRAIGRLFIDRRRSGVTNFHPDFATGLHTAPWPLSDNKLRLHLFVDWSSVEVFVDNGRLVMTEQIFPTEPYNQVELLASNGRVHLQKAQLWPLQAIWPAI
jgi:fructan beta-fructosidase